MPHSDLSQATLLQLFDRETKREKVLDGINREKLLKLKTARGLKTVRNKMKVLGIDTFKSVATRKTEMELEIEEEIRIAEQKFIESIKNDLQKRKDDKKPIIYDFNDY